MRLWVIPFLLAASILVGCETDKDRIRGSNEAAAANPQPAQPSFDPDSLSSEISPFDLREGDCFRTPSRSFIGTDGELLLKVTLVACSAEWDYRVLSSFLVPETSYYPGLDYLESLANTQCHRLMEVFFHPTEETWQAGDRTISCLLEAVR